MFIFWRRIQRSQIFLTSIAQANGWMSQLSCIIMNQCCLEMSFQSKILCKTLISLNVQWQFSWKRLCKWVISWSEPTGIVKYKFAWFLYSTRVNYQKKKKTKLDLLLKRVGFLYSFLSRPKWLFTLAQYLMFSDEMSIKQVVNESMLHTIGFTLQFKKILWWQL